MLAAYYQVRFLVGSLLIAFVFLHHCAIFVLLFGNDHVEFNKALMEISKQWQSAHIVSIYVPSTYQGQYCAGGYEAVLINITQSFLPGGPCGCAEKLEAMCPGTSPSVTDTCASLDNMPYLQSSSWGSSTICIKRGGEAPVSESPTWWSFSGYRSRPIPNGSGNCPIGYKKCGEGFNQQEGATCCPVNEDCPITNILVVPSEQKPPSDEGWESAGTFSSHNHTLYIRRQHRNELPVAQITFQLKEINTGDASTRSICSVNIFNPYHIATFPFSLWSTDPIVAFACEPRSQRYVLVDQMPLQDHFLQNLQLTEPTCVGFSLYPVSDPRYLPALDPDYLNSGVKCDFTSKYTCARDPYQRTDCAAGDNICDGVVNQNICGEYAHAVRSAFPANSSVEMGMFFEREIRWTDRCAAHKESLFGVWTSYAFYSTFGYYLIYLVFKNAIAVYGAVGSTECTDDFTRQTLQKLLQPCKQMEAHIYLMIAVLIPQIVESAALSFITLRHYTVQTRGIKYELVPIVQSAGTPPDTPAAATAQPTTVATPAVLPVK